MSEQTPPKLSPLEKLKLKRAQIDAQIKLKQARDNNQARKDDTRRKIIAGALALEHMEKNDDVFATKMRSLLDEYVVTDRERRLFDMEPLPKEQANDKGAGNPSRLKGQFPA